MCSRLCTGCGLPFGLDICWSGLRGWLPKLVFSLAYGLSSVEAWVFSCFWILKRFFLALVVISCMSWLLMSLSPSILLTGPFWIVHWVAWDYLIGFVKCIFSFHNQIRLKFKLAAGLGEPWCRDGGIHLVCPLSMVFYCGSLCPLVSSSGCFA